MSFETNNNRQSGSVQTLLDRIEIKHAFDAKKQMGISAPERHPCNAFTDLTDNSVQVL
jgi:hypothetical protein